MILFLKEDGLFVLVNYKNINFVKKVFNCVEKVDFLKYFLLLLVIVFLK